MCKTCKSVQVSHDLLTSLIDILVTLNDLSVFLPASLLFQGAWVWPKGMGMGPR